MKKFIAGLIAGISVLALTLIAVLLAPETFLQTRWRTISLSLGICAVVSMILQGLWAKQDEDAERRDRETERLAQEQERTQLYSALKLVVETAKDIRTREGAPVGSTRQAEELLNELQSTPVEVESPPIGILGDDELMTAGPRGQMFWDLKQLLRGIVEQRHSEGK